MAVDYSPRIRCWSQFAEASSDDVEVTVDDVEVISSREWLRVRATRETAFRVLRLVDLGF